MSLPGISNGELKLFSTLAPLCQTLHAYCISNGELKPKRTTTSCPRWDTLSISNGELKPPLPALSADQLAESLASPMEN